MAIKLSNETKLGLLAIIVLTIMVWGYRFLKGKNLLDNTKTYYVTYPHVDQLTVSSPVLINGYQVGTVTDITLKPDDVERILVELEVDGKISIPSTAEAILSSSGIMGGKAVILQYDNTDMTSTILKNNSFINGSNRGLLTSMVDIDEMDLYFEKIKSNISGIMDTLSSGASEEESFMKSIEEFQATIRNLSGISEKLNLMIAQSYSNFDQTMDNVAALSETLKSSGSKIENIINNLDEVSSDLKNAEIDQTISKAETAIDEVKTSLTTIQTTVKSADEAIQNVNQLITKVEQGDGSLSALINDPALYENLEKTSKNLELLLQDLRLNPKRYLNISVFGKKQTEYTSPEDDPANQ